MTPKIRWTITGLAAIWLAVLFASLFSPDMVSGSQQEHLKIPALIDWVWASLASMSILRAWRFQEGGDAAWMTVGMGTAVAWTIVALVSIFGPVVETGSDPTTIPLAAIIAPVAGLLITRFLVEFTFDVRDSI